MVFPLHWSDIIDVLTKKSWIFVLRHCGSCPCGLGCLPPDDAGTGHRRVLFHNPLWYRVRAQARASVPG